MQKIASGERELYTEALSFSPIFMSVVALEPTIQTEDYQLIVLNGRKGHAEPFDSTLVDAQLAVADSLSPIIAHVVGTPSRPVDQNEMLRSAFKNDASGAVIELVRVSEAQLPAGLLPFDEYIKTVIDQVRGPIAIVVHTAMAMTDQQRAFLEDLPNVVAIVGSIEEAVKNLLGPSVGSKKRKI